ncbi:M24 family metallopeptidase, partial [Mesotoga sp.]|uniref:M24 family metallopeptidase n=2 Tax=Mesotoga sp. TaxID=2053577 RepID=UPI0034589081
GVGKMLLEEFRNRVESLRKLIVARNAGALLLSRCCNFAWFTFGARSHITLNSTEGEASILITGDRVYLITNNIEKHRIQQIELDESLLGEFGFLEYSWFEPFGERRLVDGLVKGKILSDTGRYSSEQVDITPMRTLLSQSEIDTYRILGRECDEIFSAIVPNLKSEMTELEVQGLFYEAMAKRDIEPLLTLVFSEDSTLRYRHNLSRDVKLGRRGFASICARRRGLIASSSRSFTFEEADDVIRQHEQNCYVDAVAIGSSRPGVKLSEAFERLIEAYEKVGKAGEWKFHHQGGIAGYLPREVHANLKSDVSLREGNAVAWNPTIRGTKSEDTVLIGNEENSILSFPEESTWPSLEFEVNNKVVRRPALLVIG